MGDPGLIDIPTFLETSAFERRWKQLGLSDESLSALQWEFIGEPGIGEVVPSTGGFRKHRFAPAGSSVGKSGALRVYYLYFPDYQTFILGSVHAKNEVAAINAGGRAVLKKIAESFEKQLKAAADRRNALNAAKGAKSWAKPNTGRRSPTK